MQGSDSESPTSTPVLIYLFSFIIKRYPINSEVPPGFGDAFPVLRGRAPHCRIHRNSPRSTDVSVRSEPMGDEMSHSPAGSHAERPGESKLTLGEVINTGTAVHILKELPALFSVLALRGLTFSHICSRIMSCASLARADSYTVADSIRKPVRQAQEM